MNKLMQYILLVFLSLAATKGQAQLDITITHPHDGPRTGENGTDTPNIPWRPVDGDESQDDDPMGFRMNNRYYAGSLGTNHYSLMRKSSKSRFDDLIKKQFTKRVENYEQIVREDIAGYMYGKGELDGHKKTLNTLKADMLGSAQGALDQAMNSGRDFATPTRSENYQKLLRAENYNTYARAQVNSGNYGPHNSHLSVDDRMELIDTSEGVVQTADLTYASGEAEVGDSFVAVSKNLADAALGFVPGVSLGLDLYSIMTGTNLVTGEAVSDMEKGILLGTLFVPATVSGMGKALGKIAKGAAKLAERSPFAKKVVEVIEKSDEAIGASSGRNPCNLAHAPPKSVLEWLQKMNPLHLIVPVAYADVPCVPTGEITGDLLESAKNAGLKSADSVLDFASTSNSLKSNGKLPGDYITKDQAKALGWDSKKGNLGKVAPGKKIGGDTFQNRRGQQGLPPVQGGLPTGTTYREADLGYREGYRGNERLVYGEDGSQWVTADHYRTFTRIE